MSFVRIQCAKNTDDTAATFFEHMRHDVASFRAEVEPDDTAVFIFSCAVDQALSDQSFAGAGCVGGAYSKFLRDGGDRLWAS